MMRSTVYINKQEEETMSWEAKNEGKGGRCGRGNRWGSGGRE